MGRHLTPAEKHEAAELERVLLGRAERKTADLYQHELDVRASERHRIAHALMPAGSPSDDFEGCVE